MTGDKIRDLAGDAGSSDPIDALRAIAGLRVELDRLEAATVRRARVAGTPWQLIALALEVTRHAAHTKYGRS